MDSEQSPEMQQDAGDNVISADGFQLAHDDDEDEQVKAAQEAEQDMDGEDQHPIDMEGESPPPETHQMPLGEEAAPIGQVMHAMEDEVDGEGEGDMEDDDQEQMDPAQVPPTQPGMLD